MPKGDHTPWPPQEDHRYRQSGVWRDLSLAQAILQQVNASPQACALIDAERRWTYADLYARAQDLAEQLHTHGFVPGQYVVCHLPNCGEFFLLNLACWIFGLVPIMAVAAHRKREIEAYIQQSQAVAYFGHSRSFAQALETPGQRFVLSPHATGSLCFERVGEGSPQALCFGTNATTVGSLSRAQTQPPFPLALLQLSGGSTGTPKLIPRTHNDYLYSVEQSIRCCGFGPHTRYLAVLPLSHNFCLSSPGTLGVLISGGTIVISPSPQASIAFGLIQKYRINTSAVVPSVARMWSRLAEYDPTPLRTLEHLWIGGGPLDPPTAQRTEETLGAKVHQVYGMAEGLVCYTPLDASPKVRWHCQGSPLSPLDELLIVDSQGNPCAPGEIGELWTKGPYTIRGYFRSPAHNQCAFGPDGHYKTGDLVRQRPDGHLVVSGRVKQQINRGGEKIASIEVEGLLRMHPQVQDVAVVGLPDPVLGEKSCAVVVWKGAESPAELSKTLRRFLKQQGIALFKIPDRFVQQDTIPVSRLGKVDRPELRRALLGSSTQPEQAVL